MGGCATLGCARQGRGPSGRGEEVLRFLTPRRRRALRLQRRRAEVFARELRLRGLDRPPHELDRRDVVGGLLLVAGLGVVFGGLWLVLVLPTAWILGLFVVFSGLVCLGQGLRTLAAYLEDSTERARRGAEADWQTRRRMLWDEVCALARAEDEAEPEPLEAGTEPGAEAEGAPGGHGPEGEARTVSERGRAPSELRSAEE